MPGTSAGTRAWERVLLFALIVALVGGCGRKTYPVTGKVTFKDGTPLRGGMVAFSPIDPAAHAGARGYIQQDGTFELSTETPGDGSLGGRYRVLVKPPTLGRADDEPRNNAPLIDPRFTRFETSGLEFEVKAGPNHFPITVEPPARR